MSAVHLAPEHRVMTALLRLAGHRTPDRVAARLVELGVRGDHGCGSCPIAVYIKAQTGLDVFVGGSGMWHIVGTSALWTLPAPLTAFIARHDRGAYPELTTAAETVTAP